MKKIFLAAAFGLTAVFSAGCATGGSAKTPPQNAVKIFIRPFANKTTQYGLEDKLTSAVANEVINDGRYIIVNDETLADGTLSGAIEKYNLEPLTFTQGAVTQQYKMWISVSAKYFDKASNKDLWSETSIDGIQIYYADPSQPGGMSEADAQGVIWDNMSKDITHRLTDGFAAQPAAPAASAVQPEVSVSTQTAAAQAPEEQAAPAAAPQVQPAGASGQK